MVLKIFDWGCDIVCEFWSVLVSKDGKVLTILDDYVRKNLRSNFSNPDSHSIIAKYYGVNEDECWKYSIELAWMDEFPSKEWIINNLRYDGGASEVEIPSSYIKHLHNYIENNYSQIALTFYREMAWEKIEKMIYKSPAGAEIYRLFRIPVSLYDILSSAFVNRYKQIEVGGDLYKLDANLGDCGKMFMFKIEPSDEELSSEKGRLIIKDIPYLPI